MSTEINKEQILEKHSPSMSILFLDDVGRAYREKILSAMEEYTSQWKLKYDELKERYERYEATRHNGVPGFENVYQAAYADACDQWKDKYDALNAENDKLNDANNELMAENHVLSELKEGYEYMKDIKNDYAALKSRAQVLADALKWSLYHTKECQKKHNEFAGPLIEASEQALQSWNQGNEVFGKEGEV